MTSRFSLFTRTLRAAGGLFIAAFGIYLTIQANIGLAPWDALNMALAGRFGVSYGTASISMSILVVLADLLLGYGHYAPGTLIIKGAMALVAALVFKAFRKNTAGALIGGVAAEVVMVAGYFGYAALLLGKGIGAAASVPGNLVQGAVGLVAGFLLLQVARRTHLEEKVSV